MTIFRIMILALTTVLSVNSIAAGLSSTIPLTGGTAKPGEMLRVSLDPLYDGAKYIVDCTVKNNNMNAGDKSDLIISIQSGFNFIGRAYIDNWEVGLNKAVSYNSRGSRVTFTYTQKSDGSINFRNLDASETISVFACEAVLQK